MLALLVVGGPSAGTFLLFGELVFQHGSQQADIPPHPKLAPKNKGCPSGKSCKVCLLPRPQNSWFSLITRGSWRAGISAYLCV